MSKDDTGAIITLGCLLFYVLFSIACVVVPAWIVLHFVFKYW